MKEVCSGVAVMRLLCCFLPSSNIMSNCAARCIYTNVSTLYANFSLASAAGRADHIRNKKNASVYVKSETHLVPCVWCKYRERKGERESAVIIQGSVWGICHWCRGT